MKWRAVAGTLLLDQGKKGRLFFLYPTPEEIGIDSFQADRSPDERYRTAPLKGLWTHADGGFYHDGRFATLDDVVDHYDQFFALRLSPEERQDLVEYLKSL